VYGQDGRLLGIHRKQVLAADEARAGVRPGARPTIVETPLGQIGLLISKEAYSESDNWIPALTGNCRVIAVLGSDLDSERYQQSLTAAARAGPLVVYANSHDPEGLGGFSAIRSDGSVVESGGGPQALPPLRR